HCPRLRIPPSHNPSQLDVSAFHRAHRSKGASKRAYQRRDIFGPISPRGDESASTWDEARSVTTAPTGRSRCNARSAPAFTRRSPLRKIASENVAAGQKSFSDAMRSWEESSGHRENLLRPEVTAIGVAMAKNEDGRAYRTLVLGAE